MEIALLRIGPVDDRIAKYILEELKRAFPGVSTSPLKDLVPLPTEAYNATRDQYHSSVILSKLPPYLAKSKADRLLGVTEADLYVPSMNFVFGEAHYLWGVAVISLLRLRPEFYGQALNKRLFLERCVKEAVHEIGHTLGLDHCKNPRCVMFFSNSIQMVDMKKRKFCEDCWKKVDAFLRLK